MKHYGTEPPWQGEREHGYWRFVPADPDSWFEEETGYWKLLPPRTTLARINEVLKDIYLPCLREAMNMPVPKGAA